MSKLATSEEWISFSFLLNRIYIMQIILLCIGLIDNLTWALHIYSAVCDYLPYRVIKLTSPNLNYFLISGAVMMYSSVYIGVLYTTDETCAQVHCIVSLMECKHSLMISWVSKRKVFTNTQCTLESLICFVSTTGEMFDQSITMHAKYPHPRVLFTC